jgi:transposase
VAGVCACGQGRRRAIREGVAAPVPYGSGVSAFAGYLTHYPWLPH